MLAGVCYDDRKSIAVTERTNPPPGGSSSGPPFSKGTSGLHAMRRGGARREVTERVVLHTEDGRMLHGWALNVSRGGLRAILEEKVVLGQKFEIKLGTDEVVQRSGRVVWVQEEPDGVIVGVEFTGSSGTHHSVPPPPPDALSQALDANASEDESDVAAKDR